MTDTETLPGLGHNKPPSYDTEAHAEHVKRVAELCDAAGKWLDLTKIETDEHAEKANDFVTSLTRLKKKVEEARKAAKKPHDDAGTEVQAAFVPLTKKLDTSAKRVKSMLTPFLDKKAEEAAAEAERKRLAAEKEAAEARAAAERAASRNDVSGEVDAEIAQAKAEKAESKAVRAAKAKPKVQSYSGAGRSVGLRTVKNAEIEDLNLVFLHFRDEPALAEILTTLATRAVRDKNYVDGSVPGINVTETKVAA